LGILSKLRKADPARVTRQTTLLPLNRNTL
jgi:hypothetical protein